jgi:hypothetical protein
MIPAYAMNTSLPSPSGETNPKPAEVDFMSLFCEQLQCPVSEYEEQAFSACLYPHARIVAPLIRSILPRYFDPDFELIRYLAKCRSRRNANNELAGYVETTNARGGFARKFLRIRISTRKARALVIEVFQHHAEPPADRAGWII